jgi:Tfp pilus assembly protein PilN
MIEINLLPKDYRKGSGSLSLGKTGLYAIAGVAAVVALLIGVTFYQMHQLSQLEENIERANQRAALLRSDIQVVDALTDVKGKIQRRMTAVERLDRHRSAWVRILEDVARNVPEFVWLADFKEVAPEAAPTQDTAAASQPSYAEIPTKPVEIHGYTFTLNALAAFMIRMMRSDYFDNVELVDTRDTVFVEDEKAYNFMLTANVHYLSDEELRQLVAEAGDAGVGKPSHKSLN